LCGSQCIQIVRNFFVEHNKDIKKLQTYCSQLDTNLLWLAEQILMNEIIIL
jgi:hypothetical protein